MTPTTSSGIASIVRFQTAASILPSATAAGTRLVVAGDGENDLPLFDLADLSFAPEDSPAAIKARANHVVNVSENGLLAPILRIVG